MCRLLKNEEKSVRKNPKNPKVSEREKGTPEKAVGDIFLQPVSFGRDHEGFEPWSSWRGSHQSRYSHCSMWRIPVQGRLIFPEELLPVERPCWRRSVLKDCSPAIWTHAGARKKYKEKGAV